MEVHAESRQSRNVTFPDVLPAGGFQGVSSTVAVVGPVKSTFHMNIPGLSWTTDP
jgi:hypothetical protein